VSEPTKLDASSASEPTLIAYADDSITPDLVSGGAVILSPGEVAGAERWVMALKAAADLPPGARLHCRVMFAGDARRGTPWERLAPERIDELVVDLCRGLKALSQRPAVSLIFRSELPPAYREAPDAVLGPMHEKRLASIAYQALFAPLVHHLGPGAVRVVIDPDKTLIPTGQRSPRAQADRTRGLFIDLNSAKGAVLVRSGRW
jgi:hypothetical protein